MYTRICLWGHDLDVGYIYLNPSYRPFVVLNKTYTDIYENAAGKKGTRPEWTAENRGKGRKSRAKRRRKKEVESNVKTKCRQN